MEEFKTVRELYESYNYGDYLVLDLIDEIELEGWIKTNRDNGSIGFIEFNDGTYFKNLQLVYDKSLSNYEEVSHLLKLKVMLIRHILYKRKDIVLNI